MGKVTVESNLEAGITVSPSPLTVDNWFLDKVGTFGTDLTVDYLKDKNTGNYFKEFKEPNVPTPVQFKVKGDKWVPLDTTNKKPREWNDKQQGRAGVTIDATSTWGPWVGPWKKRN